MGAITVYSRRDEDVARPSA